MDPKNGNELLRELRGSLPEELTISAAVDAFERMSEIPIRSSEDSLLFEAGIFRTFNFTDEPLSLTGILKSMGESLFSFSLTRQFRDRDDDDEYQQLCLELYYSPNRTMKKYQEELWSDDVEEVTDFWQHVRSSPAFQYLDKNDIPIHSFRVTLDET